MPIRMVRQILPAFALILVKMSLFGGIFFVSLLVFNDFTTTAGSAPFCLRTGLNNAPASALAPLSPPNYVARKAEGKITTTPDKGGCRQLCKNFCRNF
jgi:hypothetical protein